ncbi:hypothetical protein [Knoellia sinensis]|nr:hypothetical protein [Knoellia sinensis]
MSTTPEEDRRRARRWDDPDGAVEAAQERARLATDWSAQMMALTGTGEAERGGISVEVDAEGVLRRLSVTDVVASKGGRVVELGVLTAVRAAQSDVVQQAEALTAQAWGADSRTAQIVSQEYGANLTAPSTQALPNTSGPDGGTW